METSILGFGAFDEPTMEYDCVLDVTTKNTGPTALANPSHLQEFDDQENDAAIVPVKDDVAMIYSAQDQRKLQDVQSQFYKTFPPSQANFYVNPEALSVQDDVAMIYSAQDHRKLQDIQSQFYKTFLPSQANSYVNPQALSALVLAEAQGQDFNVAIQGSSIVFGCKHNPPGWRKKILDLTPPHKRRKIISMRCSCTFKISFTLASQLVQGAPRHHGPSMDRILLSAGP
jgi:hypothetical protein